MRTRFRFLSWMYCTFMKNVFSNIYLCAQGQQLCEGSGKIGIFSRYWSMRNPSKPHLSNHSNLTIKPQTFYSFNTAIKPLNEQHIHAKSVRWKISNTGTSFSWQQWIHCCCWIVGRLHWFIVNDFKYMGNIVFEINSSSTQKCYCSSRIRCGSFIINRKLSFRSTARSYKLKV